ncbi:MAG: hypothetical protein M1833_000552 [Piccolia ochrophora]|nr:MAG: hypothetical protein M1833_000552 [Piccolia ochrophora]
MSSFPRNTFFPCPQDTQSGQSCGPSHKEWHLDPTLDTEAATSIFSHAVLLFHSFSWHESLQTHRGLLRRPDVDRFIPASRLWFNIGVIHCHLGEYALAVERFDKARDEEPELAVAWLCLGMALFQLHDFRRAERRFVVCLGCLEKNGQQQIDYEDQGLKFLLKKSEVVFNIGLSGDWKRHERGEAERPQPNGLNRMPAGLIFEPATDDAGSVTATSEGSDEHQRMLHVRTQSLPEGRTGLFRTMMRKRLHKDPPLFEDPHPTYLHHDPKQKQPVSARRGRAGTDSAISRPPATIHRQAFPVRPKQPTTPWPGPSNINEYTSMPTTTQHHVPQPARSRSSSLEFPLRGSTPTPSPPLQPPPTYPPPSPSSFMNITPLSQNTPPPPPRPASPRWLAAQRATSFAHLNERARDVGHRVQRPPAPLPPSTMFPPLPPAQRGTPTASEPAWTGSQRRVGVRPPFVEPLNLKGGATRDEEREG